MSDTKSLTLPVTAGIVIVRSYMTGLIDQQIRRIMLGANKSHMERQVDPNGDASQLENAPTTVVIDTDPAVQIDADNKRIELMVLSVNGETEDILNKVLELPSKDVDFIQESLSDVEKESRVVADDPKVPSN